MGRAPLDDLPHASMTHGMALSGDETRLCVAGTIDDNVMIVNLANLPTAAMPTTIDTPVTPEHTIATDHVPYWATTSADGNSCIVSISGAGGVHVIDFATGATVAQTPTGDFPQRNRIGRMPQSVIDNL